MGSSGYRLEAALVERYKAPAAAPAPAPKR
jgi:hypothetical protein